MPKEVEAALDVLTDDIVDMQTNLFLHGIWYTLIVTAVVIIASLLLMKLLDGIFKRRKQGNLRFFHRLLNVVITLIAVLIIMMTITPLASFARTLLAGSGLIAVVIGIAAQASLGNVFSGISIGISRPFVIGETIEIIGKNITGVVTEISLRQTVIRDLNNKRVVVPNSVIDKEVIRTVEQHERAVLSYLKVGVGYDSDLSTAIRIMKEAVLAHRDFYDTRTDEAIRDGKERSVDMVVLDLADSAVILRASVWSKDAGTGFVMLSDLRQTILSAFQKQGIEVPYPYLNVITKEAREGTG